LDEMYLSPKEVASRLSLDRKTIYKAIDAGELRAYKIGTRIRIKTDDLDRWLETCAL